MYENHIEAQCRDGAGAEQQASPDRRIFGRRLLLKIAGSGSFGAPPPREGDHSPPLQDALVAWLEGWPRGEEKRCDRRHGLAFLLMVGITPLHTLHPLFNLYG